MAIVKTQSHRIRSLRFDAIDADVLLAVLQDFLSGAMAPNFGRWGIDPQVLAGHFKVTAVVKYYLKDPRLLMQDQFRRTGFRSHNQITSANHTGENRIKEAFCLPGRRNRGSVLSVTDPDGPIRLVNSFDTDALVRVPYLPIERISAPIRRKANFV